MDSSRKSLGLSVDLGTTTIAAALWDLNEKRLLGQQSRENPQRKYGLDVIARILYSQRSESALKGLQKQVISCINSLSASLLEGCSSFPDDIRRLAVVGNTAMMCFFFGESASSLSQAPFSWDFVPPAQMSASSLGLDAAGDAMVHTLPNISGHIGSDITAAMIYGGFQERQPGNSGCTRLLMDLGTNGELVLQAGKRFFACSTAVGPAFEAGAVSCGMIAAEGAIDQASCGEDGVLRIHTVGEAQPRGLCGSGLVDCVAALLKSKVITRDGRLSSGSDKGFLLFPGERFGGRQLYLTQKDVRQLQLAKAAVAAGIRILLNHAGISQKSLDQICLAGAFGNVLSPESAEEIGLFPAISREKIRVLGNAAGAGASQILLNPQLVKQAAFMAESVQRIELADEPEFQRIFLENMSF